jgi:hypothetical protein
VGGRMTGEEFMQLYLGDRELRQFIVDFAKTLTKKKYLQKALVCKAWEILGVADNNKTMIYYKTMARITMKKEYVLYKFGEKVYPHECR